MKREFVIECIALYWPVCLAAFFVLLLRPSRRELAAIAMAVTWQAASLAMLNAWAQHLQWWEFGMSQWSVFGMPASLYLGWIVLWGVAAVLIKRYTGLLEAIVILFVFDVVLMPMMQPVLVLGEWWLLGEGVLIVFGLLPGMLLAQWVVADVRPGLRASLISVAFVSIVMILLPVIGSGESIQEIIHRVSSVSSIFHWKVWGFITVIFIVGLPALAAVIEFSREGKGTPIPFDPPKCLVDSGVYSYIANPMQFSMFWVLLLEGLFIQNWICILLALVSVIYSEGIARWSENEDLVSRYGDRWKHYKKTAPRWRFRLLPVQSELASLYYAPNCSVCSEIGSWFVQQATPNLKVMDADSYSGETLTRITYISITGERRQGVDAIAAAIQHIHLGWAWIGWLIQLPVLSHVIQLALDASGAAPAKEK